MCGITAGIIRNPKENKYWDLLKISDIRGQDGTGISVVKELSDDLLTIRWKERARDIVNPVFYKDEKELSKFTIIGQNRLAIFGQTHENDQPLVTNRFSLVHNGNLYNFEKQFEALQLERKLQVDTELILRLIENYLWDINLREGNFNVKEVIIKNAIRNVMNNLDGFYACILLDSILHTLTIFCDNMSLYYYNCDFSGNSYVFSTKKIGKKTFGSDKTFVYLNHGEIKVFDLTT